MYGLIYLLTIMLIVDNRIISSRLFPLIWFLVMFCLSLAIRWPLIQDGYFDMTGDLGGYIYNFSIQGNLISYHWREPIFFIGTKFLYIILGNPGLVFLTLDSLLFLIFYKAIGLSQSLFSKPIVFNNIKYLYFAAFLAYPFISGMHNHYRQILAITFVLYSIGCAEKKPTKGYFFFLISILIHNATVLFLPIYLLIQKRNLSINLFLTGVLFTILIFFLPFEYIGEEVYRRFAETETRNNLALRTEIYLYLLLFCSGFIILLEYLSKRDAQTNFVKILILLTLVYFVSFWVFANQPASRVFFMVLTLLFLLIGLYIEVRFKAGSFERLTYFHISLIPLLGLSGDGLIYEFGV